jgi:hypothetical protein
MEYGHDITIVRLMIGNEQDVVRGQIPHDIGAVYTKPVDNAQTNVEK